MKKFIFFGIVLVVSLSLFNCGNGTGKTPANPRDAADMYIKAAQSGDVKAVENLSTERYKKRAEKEVRRFKKFSNNYQKIYLRNLRAFHLRIWLENL